MMMMMMMMMMTTTTTMMMMVIMVQTGLRKTESYATGNRVFTSYAWNSFLTYG
jgi:hypothetical protein